MAKIATLHVASGSEIRYHCCMEPASSIIKALGGPTRVARLLGRHRTRVSKWQAPKASGGTGGLIPQRFHGKLIAHAQSIGFGLEAADFLPKEALPGGSDAPEA